jgi:predicted AAA+ superfamily ATPase
VHNAAPVETDEEVIARIGERFDILDQMTKATIAGDVRAMIVVGPPGVGKSYGVEKQLEHSGLFDKLSGRKIKTSSAQAPSVSTARHPKSCVKNF